MIVWSESSLVIVDKPHGLATQSPPGEESLQTRLAERLGASNQYLQPIHRLDVATAGLVMFGLSKKVTRLLSDQFASGKIEKVYHAVVRCGYPRLSKAAQMPAVGVQQKWTDSIAKIPNQACGIVVDANDPTGKFCESVVTVMAIENDAAGRPLAAGLRMQPSTGRMHQLRIQAATRGMAIQGDTLYDGSDPPVSPTKIDLAAVELTFHHPKTGVRTTVRRG